MVFIRPSTTPPTTAEEARSLTRPVRRCKEVHLFQLAPATEMPPGGHRVDCWPDWSARGLRGTAKFIHLSKFPPRESTPNCVAADSTTRSP